MKTITLEGFVENGKIRLPASTRLPEKAKLRFALGAVRICKTDTRYASPPEVGEQVVLFVPRRWNSDRAGAFLNAFDEAGILTIKADGSVSFPKRYLLKSKGAA